MKFNSLEIYGWEEFRGIESDYDLLQLAKSLGEVVAHPNGDNIFHLEPKLVGEGMPGTLSNQFGYGRFPMHTDCAFLAIPIRYVVFCSIESNSCKTMLASVAEVLKNTKPELVSHINKAIFKINIKTKPIYVPLSFKEKGTTGFRYDRNCMLPVNESAREVFEFMAGCEPIIQEIEWIGGTAVVVDNWKMLHGRNAVLDDEKRVLRRIYVK
jgi:alpha-ketoglutarate-dependent taurine dioxygenase